MRKTYFGFPKLWVSSFFCFIHAADVHTRAHTHTHPYTYFYLGLVWTNKGMMPNGRKCVFTARRCPSDMSDRRSSRCVATLCLLEADCELSNRSSQTSSSVTKCSALGVLSAPGSAATPLKWPLTYTNYFVSLRKCASSLALLTYFLLSQNL